MRDIEKRGRDLGRGEKQATCRESYAGLDPGTQGSQPEPKADAQPLSHPGLPNINLNGGKQRVFSLRLGTRQG